MCFFEICGGYRDAANRMAFTETQLSGALFTVVFYGRQNFCRKITQFCAVHCKPDSLGSPLIRILCNTAKTCAKTHSLTRNPHSRSAGKIAAPRCRFQARAGGRGLSRRRHQDRTPVAVSTRVERGERNLSFKKLCAIAQTFGRECRYSGYASLKSPVWSCVSITLPASS